MNIRTIIVDDDLNSRRSAAAALSNESDFIIASECEDSDQLKKVLKRMPADLVILDIELDQESGFQVASWLRDEYPEIMVVFLTGHSSYAIDGYDFHPVDFLTKPINPLKLEHTLSEIRRRMEKKNTQQEARLLFRTADGYRLIDVRDICFVERNNRRNWIHTENETIRITNDTMRGIEDMLSPHGFMLVHQSFIVSLYRITAVRDAGRQLYEAAVRGSDKSVPISRNRYEELMEALRRINVK